MKRIRGGSGFGDALYVRAIVEHLVRSADTVISNGLSVCTKYPELFSDLPVKTEPFGKVSIDILAHYTKGKSNPRTTQWQDVCTSVYSRPVDLPFKISWVVKNTELVGRLRESAKGKPLVLVHGGRVPMGRKDNFGIELLPDKRAFDAVISGFKDCYTVRFGHDNVYPLDVDLDIGGQTTTTDVMDLGVSCDGVIGQCSLAIPLAEAFDRPLMAVWAKAGLKKAKHAYIRQITPQKLLEKQSSMFVVDSWTDEQIHDEVRALRLLCG